MKTLYLENSEKITKNKWILEKILKIKIIQKEKDIIIDGETTDEFIAEKVILAINMGFPLKTAFMIKEAEFFFDIINIKDYTKRHDLETIRGRIIGTGGKTLKTLTQLTDCHLEIKDNKIGIIGPPECIEKTRTSLISLIKGSKQANVYAYLEHHKTEVPDDLGLKEIKKKKKIKKIII